MVALVCGFFISLGTLNFTLTFITILFGDLIPDTIYYNIGRYGNKKKFLEKYKQKIGLSLTAEKSLNTMWFKHGGKTLSFAKLAYGVAIPFLISAGLAKYPFKKFLGFCTIISGIKILFIIGIGYYLGSSYQKVGNYLNYFHIALTVILIMLIIIYVFFIRKVRYTFAELEKENEIS